MSWVVFDFGGVISTPQPEEDVAALAAAAAVCPAGFSRAYWPPRFAYDIGELSAETFWQDVAGRLGRSFSRAYQSSTCPYSPPEKNSGCKLRMRSMNGSIAKSASAKPLPAR